MKVFLQADNEKPVLIPVKDPSKIPSNSLITIKGKKYRIFSVDIAPVIEIFWKSESSESKEKRGLQDTGASGERKNYNKWLENMREFKRTKKYPKE